MTPYQQILHDLVASCREPVDAATVAFELGVLKRMNPQDYAGADTDPGKVSSALSTMAVLGLLKWTGAGYVPARQEPKKPQRELF